MNDQIIALINALHLCKNELAEVYANPQGVFYDPETQGTHFAKLVTVKAVRPAHDGTYRLDSRLKKFFDWAINRRSLYGNSTHYQDILLNLESAVTGYLESLARASHTEMGDKLAVVFELCDDFASGMTEDIEQFRFFLDTQHGFAGGSLEEKIAYNRNRLARAKELISNVSRLSDLNLMEQLDPDDSLARVLRKELFDRHGDIQARLYEVQRNLSESLFRLGTLNASAMRLIALDNHLAKHQEISAPAWDDPVNIPEWALIFPGIDVTAYPDPGNDAYSLELQKIAAAIKDELPAAEKPRRTNRVADDGVPPVKEIPVTRYRESLDRMIEYVTDYGPTSAMDWLDQHGAAFPFDGKIWLQLLSSDLANDTLDVPNEMCFTPCHIDEDDILFLVDFEVKIDG